MKAISIACSVTLLSLFVGGCGGTDSSHSSRKIDSSLTGLSEDRTDSNGVDGEAADSPRVNPLEPLVIDNSHGWIRIETPGLLDTNSVAAVNDLSVALESVGEAIAAHGFTEPPVNFNASNGQLVDISSSQWFQLSNQDGILEAGFPQWVVSPITGWHTGEADPAYGDLAYPPFLWGTFALDAQGDTVNSDTVPSNLSTLALSVGLPETSQAAQTESVRDKVVIPMQVATPCGEQAMRMEFQPAEGVARHWKASLFFGDEKIPVSMHGQGTPSAEPVADALLAFDHRGYLEVNNDAYVLLNSGNLSTLIEDEQCHFAGQDDWRVAIVLQQHEVILIGEQYPLNSIATEIPYHQITPFQITLNSQTVTAEYIDGTRLNIGYAMLKLPSPDSQERVFTNNPLHLTTVGAGYFVLSSDITESEYTYTRFGDFHINADGVAVNTEGKILQIYPVDNDGNVTSLATDRMIPLQISHQIDAPSQATSAITLDVSVSDLATPLDITQFDAEQSNTYNASTSLIVYDAQGRAYTATLYFIRDNNIDNQWVLFCLIDGRRIRFDDGTGHPQDYIALTFDQPDEATLTLHAYSHMRNFPESAWSQSLSFEIHASTSIFEEMPFNVNTLEQDGYGNGVYAGVYVDYAGRVQATYDNGQTVTLGKIALATFPQPQGLTPVGSSAWEASAESGDAQLGEGGTAGFGYIHSGALEAPWLP